MTRTNLWMCFPLVALLCLGCDNSTSGTDGGEDGDNPDGGSGKITVPAECGTSFPGVSCSGVPIGEWTLVGVCFETYEDCEGASVTITGTLEGSLSIGIGGQYGLSYDLDYEQRISVPRSCLGGASCDSIDCFGTDHCSCVHGVGSGGFQSGDWTLRGPGRVSLHMHDGDMEFCAGDTLGDSMGGGKARMIWRRADCPEGFKWVEGRCRPTAGCETDGAPCDDALACTSDTGAQCSQGVCLSPELDCGDALDCTVDMCPDGAGGCLHIPVPTGGPEGYLGDPICTNGLDDDCDGLSDAADDDCLTLPCTLDADCPDDGNPCTTSRCLDGYCRWPLVPDATLCPGSDECASFYLCRGADCLPGPSDKDSDGDGAVDGQCPGGFDCDDADPLVHPGAEGPQGSASCADGLDTDCDALVDAFDPSCWPLSCTPEGWCFEQPRTGGEDLNAVWATAPDDAWALGNRGGLLHWDGTGWARMESPSIWGINDVCGCTPDDVWAVGLTGDILHWDGAAWQLAESPSEPHRLYGIWCGCDQLPMQDAWAVGRPGIILHWDGAAWTLVQNSGSDLNGVWVGGPDNGWAVGDQGTLLRYQGGVWQAVDSGTAEDLNTVWGRGATEAWVAGGELLHYDGNGWLPLTSGEGIRDIWGLPDADPWAVGSAWDIWRGSYGIARVWQNGAWAGTSMFGSRLPPLNALHGSGATDLWAVGDNGVILHSDGQTGTSMVTSIGFIGDLCAVEDAGGNVQAYAVGRSEEAYLAYNGSEWQTRPASFDNWMVSIWCAGEHGLWAIDDDGVWVHWAESFWETGQTPDLPLANYLNRLTGRYTDAGVELLAVGDEGLIAHLQHGAWTVQNVPMGFTSEFQDVWLAPDPADPLQAVTAGDDGALYILSDGQWTRQDVGVTADLHGVWSDGAGAVWVVGYEGAVFQWDGAAFQPVAVPGDPVNWTDVGGTGPDDVWLVGWDSALHWDGAVWTPEPLPQGSEWRLAVTPSHVWAVSGDGTILHRAP